MKKTVISTVVGIVSGAVAAGYSVTNTKNKEIEGQRSRAVKNATVIDSLARWISIMQDKKTISEYFINHGYNTVIIYGYHYIGERLYRDLLEAGIEVRYAIDQNRNVVNSQIEIRCLDDELDEADVIVVTPVYYYKSIEQKLQEIFDCPIVSFDDILAELEE